MALTLKSFVASLLGGLVAGTLDITYACIFSYLRRGTTPAQVLRYVASGAFGEQARTAGTRMAVIGLGFHFLIAIIAAIVYYLASRVLGFMLTHAVISGIIYGLCVYVVMNCVVLPLSAIHSRTFPWSYPWPVLVGGLLIHMFGIGLPIALAVSFGSRLNHERSPLGN